MKKKPHSHLIFYSSASLDDFSREILIVCPKCRSRARIFVVDATDTNFFAARRLICPHCAFVREWNAKTVRRGSKIFPITEGFFGARLWLQTACGSETLWAFNPEHLAFIENYVRAGQRKRARRENYGWNNRNLSSRLPKWISAAHNREIVLKAVKKLRRELVERN